MKKGYLLFDVSGSTENQKEYYKNIYEYYKLKFDKVVTIGYTTIAKYVCMDDILNQTYSGGTYISSGIRLIAGDVLSSADHSTIIICSDGGNWSEDNDSLYRIMNKLHNEGVKFIYHEILPQSYSYPIGEKLNSLNLSFTLEKYTIKNKEQDIFGKQLETYLIYEIEHKLNGKRYLFRSKKILDIDTFVLCNTKYGKTYGKIVGATAKLLNYKDYLEYNTIEEIN